MVREYTFPDEKDQGDKERMKNALNACESREERQAVFMAYLMDTSIRRPVIHQAIKECGLNDKLEPKEPR